VTTTDAKKYANRIFEAYFDARDDIVMELVNEIRSEHEFCQSVWAYFPAPMRRRLKEIIGDL
jgi:hypothetical protein